MSTPTCLECGASAHWLGTHLAEVHGIGLDEYLAKHPAAPLVSDEVMSRVPPFVGERRHPPKTPTVSFAGLPAPLHMDVEVSACLPLPNAYRFPTQGDLVEDVTLATLALLHRRHTYIWGEAGAGKDALVHAWSYYTQSPAKLFQVKPGVDIQAWFFSHEFTKDGTYWREGPLLTALRDGYSSPLSGRRLPYIILITDLDRATLDQQETLRMVLDSIEGRVEGPNGVVYNTFPGTMVVATGNTAGGGDVRGRYASAKIMDASILDRFERVIQFHWMHWEDEVHIVRDKFPFVHSHDAKALDLVGACVDSIRGAIGREELYAEFSHRATCAWVGQAQDMITTYADMDKRAPVHLWRDAFRIYADKLPDMQTRAAAYKLIDPHFVGGAFKS
jgi:MoxR-like ATPase